MDGGGVRDGAPLVASVTSRTTCIEECALLSISPTTQCVSAYRPSPSDQGARSRALVRPFTRLVTAGTRAGQVRAAVTSRSNVT